MFHAAGVPAPRVTNARVWLNGRDLGFYVLIEGFTRDFLGRYFKHTHGNLYDGGFLKDVTDTLDKESGGNSKDESDLKRLATAAQEPAPSKRWERLNQTLAVERFISFLAMEVLVWDWDGYMMNRNNYRVYHDRDTGKMMYCVEDANSVVIGDSGAAVSPRNFLGDHRDHFTKRFRIERFRPRFQRLDRAFERRNARE